MRTRVVPVLVTVLAGAGLTALVTSGTSASAAVPRAHMVNIADNFDAPDQTAQIGGSWTATPTGAWTRSGGVAQLAAAAGTSSFATLAVDAGNEEFATSLSITNPPVSGRGYFGAGIRLQDNPNLGYTARIKWEAGAKTLQITDTVGTPIAATDPNDPDDLVNNTVVANHAYTLTTRITGTGPVTITTVLADMDSDAIIGRLTARSTGTPADYARGTFGVYDRGQATSSPSSPASAVGMNVLRVLGTNTAQGAGAAPPDASNTGSISTQLTPYTGPSTITTSQSGKIFSSQIKIGADNVTISDSVIASGKVALGDEGMISNRSTNTHTCFKNAVIRDVTFAPSDYDVNSYGFFGCNTTLINVDISHVVDGIDPAGPSTGADVYVYNSYIHDMQWYASDPRQGNTQSHGDVVQTVGSPHFVAAGNTFEALLGAGKPSTYNAGSVWQTGQTYAPLNALGQAETRDQVFSHNSISGGGCSINISGYVGGNPDPMPDKSTQVSGITITYNQIVPGTQELVGCYISAPKHAYPNMTLIDAPARVAGAYFTTDTAPYTTLNPLRNYLSTTGDPVTLSNGG